MGSRVYVGNLPFSCDEAQLRALFAQDGRTVTEVKIAFDPETRRPRGFGFVQLASDDDARRAIDALHGQSFGGRRLTVSDAHARAPRSRRRSGGGGRARA